MSATLRTKLGWAIATVIAGLLAAGIAFIPLTDRWPVKRELEASLATPIILPSKTIRPGITRAQVKQLLGDPAGISADGNTYYYLRKLRDYGKDQILVIRFKGDKVVLIDSNVNLGSGAAATTCSK